MATDRGCSSLSQPGDTRRQTLRLSKALGVFASLLLTLVVTLAAAPTGQATAPPAASGDSFRGSSVMFIENAVQWDEGARFQVWGAPCLCCGLNAARCLPHHGLGCPANPCWG